MPAVLLAIAVAGVPVSLPRPRPADADGRGHPRAIAPLDGHGRFRFPARGARSHAGLALVLGAASRKTSACRATAQVYRSIPCPARPLKSSVDTLGDGLPAVRGTSFVRRDLAALWHHRHPHWRFVADGGQSDGTDLIRVPQVQLGAGTLSNVWFSTRPHDDVFEGDAVAGKLGGTAFVGKMFILDYPKRIAIVSPSKG
jgi:hypothetical protein